MPKKEQAAGWWLVDDAIPKAVAAQQKLLKLLGTTLAEQQKFLREMADSRPLIAAMLLQERKLYDLERRIQALERKA